MARPIYQYKPIENNDTALGILFPFNKDAKGKSPTAAYLRFEPPSTFIHSTLLAPVLSATINSV